MSPRTPSFSQTTTLVARALGMAGSELQASFRAARHEDLPSIMDVRRRVIGDHLTWNDEQYLKWRYDFDGRSDARGRCLVVCHGSRVLGMIGAEFVRIAIRAERHDALSLMDIMVDPKIDGSGLGIWLNMAVFQSNPVVIEIGANPNSIGLITRLFDRLPDRREYIAPLTLKRYLSSRVRSKIIARVLAAPIDAALAAGRALTSRRAPREWHLHPIKRFDASVDRLFSRRSSPSDVMFERTAGYLNWRMFGNPRARYSVLGAYSNAELVGYAAYQLSQRSDGLRVVILVDWLVDERFGQAGIVDLIQQAVRFAAKDEADFVSVNALHARTQRRLWRLGFVSHAAPFNTVGVHFGDRERYAELLDGSRWFLTEANTDVDGIA